MGTKATREEVRIMCFVSERSVLASPFPFAFSSLVGGSLSVEVDEDDEGCSQA